MPAPVVAALSVSARARAHALSGTAHRVVVHAQPAPVVHAAVVGAALVVVTDATALALPVVVAVMTSVAATARAAASIRSARLALAVGFATATGGRCVAVHSTPSLVAHARSKVALAVLARAREINGGNVVVVIALHNPTVWIHLQLQHIVSCVRC